MDDTNRSPEQGTGLTFADMNIDIPRVTNQPIETAIGKCQRFQDLTILEKVFFILMLASIVTAACFTISRMSTLERTHPDFTFCIFLLVNAAFCIYFTVDSILRERPSELIVLMITQFVILLYLIINYAAGKKNDVKLSRLVIACLFCPVLLVMGGIITKQYIVSGHLIFRTVGASENLQKLYRNVLYFQDGLKFDLQLGVSLVILVLDGDDGVETHEIIILSIGLVANVVYFLLGWFAFEREIKYLAIIYWIIGLLEFGYVFWKIYDVSFYVTKFAGLAGATITCIVADILMRTLLLIGSYFVYRNFGKGLKDNKAGSSTFQNNSAIETIS
ncbi:hypothetical protein Bpfe_007250 [Biomphalaria pfeifferi]|uniref:DUF7789 domain-containing protein n=1 Tax=Biomphalaria pfeifferi TaxID=112525 RepID=A0AAD8C1D6_BIOPF|nr:hypothetical protein Bpfe_007250 [Biomphalaria pfeifferi]